MIVSHELYKKTLKLRIRTLRIMINLEGFAQIPTLFHSKNFILSITGNLLDVNSKTPGKASENDLLIWFNSTK